MRSSNASVLLATFISIVLGAVTAQTRPSAIELFRDLRAHLQQNRKDNDWKAGLENAKALSDFLNGSPLSLMEVARAELQVGHEAEAWAEVERFLAMGQTSTLLTSPMFAGLHADASHPNIPEVMKRNQTAVGLGSTAFILRDTGLVPEDIGYDSATKRFYLSSVLKKKIIVVDDQGNAKDFAEGPNHWPMLALSVDSKRGLLWATEVAPDGFSSVPKADWGRSAVVGYELASGKLRFRIPGPQPSALGDMTLAENGDPIVSDGDGGGVYRVHDGQMERVDGGDFVSPQTPAISGDEKHIFIPDYVRGIGELDPTTKKVKWLSGEGEHALTGVDGFYVANGMLLAVQNGTSPERVIAFRLDAAAGKISGEQAIERSTETLGDPTHGVIVGTDFYYIANSGWDKLDDHGDWLPGKTPTPARIMRVGLGALHPN